MEKIDVPIIVFVLGWVFLSRPLLAVFDGALPVYLFVVWGLLIGALAWMGRHGDREGEG